MTYNIRYNINAKINLVFCHYSSEIFFPIGHLLFFDGFTGAIDHVECWENARKLVNHELSGREM